MKHSVLVVGAGPTGLVLALWLAKAGISVRIIDKNTGPGQASRAMAVQARTLEFYRQLGISDRIVEAGIVVNALHLRKGSREIAEFRFGDIGDDLSPFPFVLTLPQDDHERLLVVCLKEAGVEVEWVTELVSFIDEGGSVRAQLGKDGGMVTVECSYLCGCDGVHSIVRQSLKLEFPGGTYQQLFYVADVAARGASLGEGLNISVSSDSLLLAFPIRSTGMFRLIGVVPRELVGRDQVTFEQIRPYVKRQIDVDVEHVNWFSTYHVHHRVAEHFCKGRVFIAGDAGHVHSPAGGQGMNTGIGDAVNLAWKLADVVRGTAKPELLDSYEFERIAYARALVATTDRLFQIAVGPSIRSKLIRNLILPTVAPLLLRLRAVRRAQFRVVSQTMIRYTRGPVSRGAAGTIRGGTRLPWLNSQDNYAPLRAMAWQVHLCGTSTDGLKSFASHEGIQICPFEWNEEAQSAGFARDAVYLVRPDGYVALASADQDPAKLRTYLSDWQIA